MPDTLPDPTPSDPALPTHLDLWQRTLHWQPTAAQRAQFQQFYGALLRGNQRLNLTRIREPDEFWEKHLWDALSGLAPWLSSSLAAPLRVIDIGTGGGVPGIPAAIALGAVNLTLLDATHKKIQFLQALCQHMGITASCIAQRAEILGRNTAHRAQYDLALVRAVGPAATCAEYALPFLKLGGRAVLYRGQWTRAQTAALQPVVELLGAQVSDVAEWHTPITASIRHCLHLCKVAPTPDEFPRAVGVPAKKPLT